MYNIYTLKRHDGHLMQRSQFLVFQQNRPIIQQTHQLIDAIFPILLEHLDKKPDATIMSSITQQFEAMLEKVAHPEYYTMPKDSYFFDHIGQIYMQQQQYDKAIDCFNRALTLEPDNLKYIRNRQLSYEECGDKQKEESETQLYDVLCQIAELAEEYRSKKVTRKKMNKMSDEIRILLVKAPKAVLHVTDEFVLTALGQFFANRGVGLTSKEEYQQAVFLFTILIHHSSKGFINDYPCHTIDALRSRAWCLKQLGQLEAARQDEMEVERLMTYQGVPWQKIGDTDTTNLRDDFDVASALRIGEGSFGTVIKTTFQQKSVAVKMMHPTDEPLYYWHFNNEVDIHSKLSHPHVLAVLGSHRAPQLNGRMALITPLMQCTLTTLLEDLKRPMSWRIRLRWAAELLAGVTYIHQQNILHRDLKSDNVLLDENNQIKIADFGSASDQSDTSFYRYLLRHDEAGSWGYWAPEIFKNKPYTEKSDIWAASLILWQLSSREKPYQACETKKQLEQQLLQEIHLPFAADTPVAFKALTMRGWALNAEHRPNAATMVQELDAMVSEDDYCESELNHLIRGRSSVEPHR